MSRSTVFRLRKAPFDPGQILVGLDRLMGVKLGGRHAGANAVKTVEAGLRLDPLDAPAKVKCRSPMSRSKCLAIFLLSTTAPTDRPISAAERRRDPLRPT
jgi:hypothetical protein